MPKPLIDVFKRKHKQDESFVYDVEVAVDDDGNTVVFDCVDEEHANRLVSLISQCVDVYLN